MSAAEPPIPRDDELLEPPTRKNSYGWLSGGVYPRISRDTAFATSRDPPLVVWSFPAPSIVTPSTFHLAAHSSFQGSLPAPPNGLTHPSEPQPTAQDTSDSMHW